jgi:hypothetical protein
MLKLRANLWQSAKDFTSLVRGLIRHDPIPYFPTRLLQNQKRNLYLGWRYSTVIDDKLILLRVVLSKSKYYDPIFQLSVRLV